MKSETAMHGALAPENDGSVWQRLARHHVFSLLSSLHGGSLTLAEGRRTFRFGDTGSADGLHVRIRVTDPRMYAMLLLRGSIGAGEAYMAGYWQSPDLTGVIRLMCRNLAQIERMDGGLSRAGNWLQRMRHRVSANTRRGAKRNIHAHYDLSNELFATFLDQRMMYSSAIFPSADTDLDTAAAYKLERVGEKLELAPGDHVLEIGSGWGGLAIYLAERFGCRVTTTTISAEQRHFALDRIAEKGLSERITVLGADYRDLTGQYDKLVSIEMIEAVGQRYLGQYLSRCDSLLKPGGRLLIQAITIPEQRYLWALRNVDFIQRYIFPGGSLPSVEAILHAAGRHSRLQLKHLEDIGHDYARTLNHWHRRFMQDPAGIRALGFDDRFIRMWQFYLCYCEGGFLEDAIGTAQLLMQKV
jgi:cyclopropane-fatty-acyl-phospholipid synthase